MPKEKSRVFCYGVAWGWFVTMLTYFAVTEFVAKPRNMELFEREAIQSGVAEWSVDEDGSRIFRWRRAK